jgi:hypothetical protein
MHRSMLRRSSQNKATLVAHSPHCSVLYCAPLASSSRAAWTMSALVLA